MAADPLSATNDGRQFTVPSSGTTITAGGLRFTLSTAAVITNTGTITVASSANTTVNNIATTSPGTALSGNANVSSNGNVAQAGTYTATISRAGVAGSFQNVAAAAVIGTAETIQFSGGVLNGTVTASLSATNSDTLAHLATSLQSQLNNNAGFNAYTVTSNSSAGTVSIQSNVFAGALTVGTIVPAGTSGGITGLNTGNTDGGIQAQVQLSGGNLTSPQTITADAATNVTTNNGTRFTVSSGVASGLQFNIGAGNTSTNAVGTSGTIAVAGSDTLTINGTAIALTYEDANTVSLAASTINDYTGTTGVKATLDSTGQKIVLTATKLGGGDFTFSEAGGNIGISNSTLFAQHAQDLQGKFYDVSGNQLGGVVTGSGAGGNVLTANGGTFGNADGLSFTFNYASGTQNGVADTQSPAAVSGAGQYSASVTLTDALVFQIGPNQNQTASLSIQDTSSSNLGKNVSGLSNSNTDSLAKINVTTTAGANDALKVIDQAISDISSLSGQLGSFQTNTLEATATNLQTALTNTTAAQSVIRDTDFAAETANFTKAQVLVQAGTTVLTNANATAQLILNLLK